MGPPEGIVYNEDFYPVSGPPDGYVDAQLHSNNATQQGLADDETQDGHDPEPEVKDKWEFSDTELVALTALDRTFDEFYWRREE